VIWALIGAAQVLGLGGDGDHVQNGQQLPKLLAVFLLPGVGKGLFVR
jgi:hypothetical protein